MIGRVHNDRSGFSLVELLIVIAVLGVVAALGIPAFHRLTANAEKAKDHQNARCLASVTQSAQAAGVDFVDADGDLDATIRNIQAGGVGVRGAFSGQVFRVNISENDIPGAKRFLRVQSGLLLYVSE